MILGVSSHETIWKPFCWPFSFLTQTSIFCQIAHHQSLLSYLNKHFPRGCAFCLLLKLCAENFDFFINFESFSLFFILHAFRQDSMVLRNLVICNYFVWKSLVVSLTDSCFNIDLNHDCVWRHQFYIYQLTFHVFAKIFMFKGTWPEESFRNSIAYFSEMIEKQTIQLAEIA